MTRDVGSQPFLLTNTDTRLSGLHSPALSKSGWDANLVIMYCDTRELESPGIFRMLTYRSDSSQSETEIPFDCSGRLKKIAIKAAFAT